MNASDIVRTGHVKRWQIIRTHRDQTIGEHMYQVAMLSLIILDKVDLSHLPGLILYKIKSDVMEEALFHDVPEIDSGDHPTPYKKATERGREVYADFEKRFWEARRRPMSLSQTYATCPHGRVGACPSGGDGGTYSSIIRTIVSIADRMEAILFLAEEAVGKRGKDIQEEMIAELKKRLDKADRDHLDVEWDGVRDFVFESLRDIHQPSKY